MSRFEKAKLLWLMLFLFAAAVVVSFMPPLDFGGGNDMIIPLSELVDFDRATVRRAAHNSPVARLVHQTWRTARVRADQATYVASWPKVNPDFTYVFWDDVDCRLLVSTFFPNFLPRYDAYKTPVQRADVARYLIMEVFGGVYADMDFEATKSFADLADAHPIAVAPEPKAHWALYEGGKPLLCNAILLSRRRHPFWRFLRARLAQAFRELGSSGDTIDLTGPGVFNAAVEAW